MSEIMLQRSLSASSLIKQAAAAVQAQQKDSGSRRMARPRLERATTDYITFPFSSRQYSTGPPSMLPSTSSSGIVSPSAERKHIHFNEQVEQCIAVDAKGDDEDDNGNAMPARFNYDSDSDDGAIMMKRTASKHRMQPHRRNSYNSQAESKTIAMLPSTTLKYREDTPDPLGSGSTGSAMKHSYRSPILSPSSSQETLRPSKVSGKLFFGAEDEDDDDDDEGVDSVQQPADDDDDDDSDNDSDDDGIGMSMSTPRRRTAGLVSSASASGLGNSIDNVLQAQSIFADNSSSSGGGGGLKRTTSTSSLSAEPAGMRRTASGMFMPYVEGEPAGGGNGGLVGRVIDTVNTARDIVHVIWNVGWRS